MRSTQKALEDIIRAAKAVPEDKLTWIPMGAARSVIDQMQEVAVGGNWFLGILRELKVPEFDAHDLERAREARKANDTLEKCVAAARLSTSDLCNSIESVQDKDLERELHLPFGGGMTVTVADLVALHQWNLTYHLGQINQIQLMLGDRQMH